MKLIQVIFLFSLFFAALPGFAAQTEMATFAGGCFWSMQHDFEKVPGVMKTTVGYTGGKVSHPTYEQVSTGQTGHVEAIQIVYDPAKITYQKLLEIYWHDTDPTDAAGQFCDKGNEYRPIIFYQDTKQKDMALKSKEDLVGSGRFNHIATVVMPASTFYPAEDYHQHYSDKNPEAYSNYREGCGRDLRQRAVWGK
ncbi:MAG: peptide-methionine (S)-S-oxide reductase MsrA [Gammaproteobacteria bacterium]|nr:peptide-methionine (S)-S-oxide reductase MsrA [Gammaproteobacteria bacterium]